MSLVSLVQTDRRRKVSAKSLPDVQRTWRIMFRTCNLRILFELGRIPVLDTHQLMEAVDYSQPEVSQALRQLRKLGMVASDSVHSKALQIHSLTDKGRDAHKLLFG
jgi:DNA-binding HxlR family transcriptional regulator